MVATFHILQALSKRLLRGVGRISISLRLVEVSQAFFVFPEHTFRNNSFFYRNYESQVYITDLSGSIFDVASSPWYVIKWYTVCLGGV